MSPVGHSRDAASHATSAETTAYDQGILWCGFSVAAAAFADAHCNHPLFYFYYSALTGPMVVAPPSRRT